MAQNGSQLGLFRRIQLLIRNPKDAFLLFNAVERRDTAWFIFCAYFLIKFPVVAQKPFLQGHFDQKDLADTLLFLGMGLALGLLLSLVLFAITALVLHWILNVWKKSERGFEDALNLLLLSLAPQLFLVYELPFLLFDYASAETYVTVLVIRLVIDLFSLKTFCWGLIELFNVGRNKAFAVVFLPGILLLVLLAKLLFG